MTTPTVLMICPIFIFHRLAEACTVGQMMQGGPSEALVFYGVDRHLHGTV